MNYNKLYLKKKNFKILKLDSLEVNIFRISYRSPFFIQAFNIFGYIKKHNYKNYKNFEIIYVYTYNYDI